MVDGVSNKNLDGDAETLSSSTSSTLDFSKVLARRVGLIQSASIEAKFALSPMSNNASSRVSSKSEAEPWEENYPGFLPGLPDKPGLPESEVDYPIYVPTPVPTDRMPSDIPLTLSGATVIENDRGALIGTLSGGFNPWNRTFGYTVDDDRFEVVGGQLKLKAGVALDYEEASEVSVTVTLFYDDDGAFRDPITGELYYPIEGPLVSETFTISVVDVDQEPPEKPTLSGSTVAENQSGAVVGTVHSHDDNGDLITYTVNDQRFEVVGDQLKLKDGVQLDYETESSVRLIVTASDGTGYISWSVFDVTVTDMVEDPSLAAEYTATVTDESGAAVLTLETEGAPAYEAVQQAAQRIVATKYEPEGTIGANGQYIEYRMDAEVQSTIDNGDGTYTVTITQEFGRGYANADGAQSYTNTDTYTVALTATVEVAPGDRNLHEVNGVIDGNTDSEIIADLLVESDYSSLQEILALTEGSIPEWSDLETVAYTLGSEGLGGLVQLPEWSQFVADNFDADGALLPGLGIEDIDVSAFETAFAEEDWDDASLTLHLTFADALILSENLSLLADDFAALPQGEELEFDSDLFSDITSRNLHEPGRRNLAGGILIQGGKLVRTAYNLPFGSEVATTGRAVASSARTGTTLAGGTEAAPFALLAFIGAAHIYAGAKAWDLLRNGPDVISIGSVKNTADITSQITGRLTAPTAATDLQAVGLSPSEQEDADELTADLKILLNDDGEPSDPVAALALIDELHESGTPRAIIETALAALDDERWLLSKAAIDSTGEATNYWVYLDETPGAEFSLATELFFIGDATRTGVFDGLIQSLPVAISGPNTTAFEQYAINVAAALEGKDETLLSGLFGSWALSLDANGPNYVQHAGALLNDTLEVMYHGPDVFSATDPASLPFVQEQIPGVAAWAEADPHGFDALLIKSAQPTAAGLTGGLLLSALSPSQTFDRLYDINGAFVSGADLIARLEDPDSSLNKIFSNMTPKAQDGLRAHADALDFLASDDPAQWIEDTSTDRVAKMLTIIVNDDGSLGQGAFAFAGTALAETPLLLARIFAALPSDTKDEFFEEFENNPTLDIVDLLSDAITTLASTDEAAATELLSTIGHKATAQLIASSEGGAQADATWTTERPLLDLLLNLANGVESDQAQAELIWAEINVLDPNLGGALIRQSELGAGSSTGEDADENASSLFGLNTTDTGRIQNLQGYFEVAVDGRLEFDFVETDGKNETGFNATAFKTGGSSGGSGGSGGSSGAGGPDGHNFFPPWLLGGRGSLGFGSAIISLLSAPSLKDFLPAAELELQQDVLDDPEGFLAANDVDLVPFIETLNDSNPAWIAGWISSWIGDGSSVPDELKSILANLPVEDIAEVLPFMLPATAAVVLVGLSPAKSVDVLETLANGAPIQGLPEFQALAVSDRTETLDFIEARDLAGTLDTVFLALATPQERAEFLDNISSSGSVKRFAQLLLLQKLPAPTAGAVVDEMYDMARNGQPSSTDTATLDKIVVDFILDATPDDAAQFASGLPPQDLTRLPDILPSQTAGAVFGELYDMARSGQSGSTGTATLDSIVIDFLVDAAPDEGAPFVTGLQPQDVARVFEVGIDWNEASWIMDELVESGDVGFAVSAIQELYAASPGNAAELIKRMKFETAGQAIILLDNDAASFILIEQDNLTAAEAAGILSFVDEGIVDGILDIAGGNYPDTVTSIESMILEFIMQKKGKSSGIMLTTGPRVNPQPSRGTYQLGVIRRLLSSVGDDEVLSREDTLTVLHFVNQLPDQPFGSDILLTTHEKSKIIQSVFENKIRTLPLAVLRILGTNAPGEMFSLSQPLTDQLELVSTSVVGRLVAEGLLQELANVDPANKKEYKAIIEKVAKIIASEMGLTGNYKIVYRNMGEGIFAETVVDNVTGRVHLEINSNIFKDTNSGGMRKSKSDLLSTIFHELRHALQHEKIDLLKRGKLDISDPFYEFAVLMKAGERLQFSEKNRMPTSLSEILGSTPFDSYVQSWHENDAYTSELVFMTALITPAVEISGPFFGGYLFGPSFNGGVAYFGS